jgi:hypothetical protein
MLHDLHDNVGMRGTTVCMPSIVPRKIRPVVQWTRQRGMCSRFDAMFTTTLPLRRNACMQTGNAVILSCYQTIAENKETLLPSWAHGLPVLYLGDGPFDLAAYALSLLLVFRTDASYDRCVGRGGIGRECMQTSSSAC